MYLKKTKNEKVIARIQKKSIQQCVFLKCYLVAPRPTLGHCRGGSLINLMLITTFLTYFDPKISRSLVTRLGPKAWPST